MHTSTAVEAGLVHSITMYSTLRSSMWLPQGGALKIDSLHSTVLQCLLYLIHVLSLSVTASGAHTHTEAGIQTHPLILLVILF